MYRRMFQQLNDLDRTRIPEPAGVRLRLQRMERPEPWPGDFRDRIFSSIPADLLQRYPDPQPLYSQLALFLGVPQSHLLLTSGIDEAVKSLISLTCDPGDSVAVTWPGYAMYDVFCRMFGATLAPIFFDPERFTSADDFISRLAHPKIVFLPNPSQPVENCFDLPDLRKIARACRDRNILFVVDEAYHYFGAPSALPLVEEFENVLVLRTFSKAFGAAGIRLGYVVGGPSALGPLQAFRLAHEANALTLHVASVMIDNFDSDIRPSIEDVCAGRDWLRESLISAGVPAWGAVGNFVLVQMDRSDQMVQCVDELVKNGVYVKAKFPAPLNRHLLVTCGASRIMSSFYSQFMDFYKRQHPTK